MNEVVVYAADNLDPRTQTGWSVMVTGRASAVTAPWGTAAPTGAANPVDRQGRRDTRDLHTAT